MNKLVAFCGSPRPNGLTRQLIDHIISGAVSVGVEISFYDLNMAGIRGCQHCLYCRQHYGCSIHDPLSSMYIDIENASSILWGTPIYFHGLSGQSKIWLDRLYPMFDTPSYRARFPGKNMVTVFSQGYEDANLYRDVINNTNSLFNRFGWSIVETFHVCGVGPIAPQVLDYAYYIGQCLKDPDRTQLYR